MVPFAGYGGDGWVRVLGRVLILPARSRRRSRRGETSGVRGWRAFLGIPVGYAPVTVAVGGRTQRVVADRGGVVDVRVDADLPPGWQTVQVAVEDGEPIDARVFVVASDVRFGIVCDVDDTVMVTALPARSSRRGTPSSSTSTPGSRSPEWRCCSSGSRAPIPDRR